MTTRGPLAFAQAIVARYGRRASMRALRLVVRRHSLVHVWQQRTALARPQINLAVQIDARIVGHHTMSANTMFVSVPERWHVAMPRHASRHSPPVPARRLGMEANPPTLGKAPVVVRQTWPARRVSMVRGPVGGERVLAERTDTSPPPARVLRQAAAIASSGASMTGEVPALASMTPVIRQRPVSSGGNPAKPAGVAVDMRALTDQVIRTIDQRIAAQRERMGRI